MKKDIIIFIKHILEGIESIENFSRGISKIKFLRDELRQNAIIRKLEIIGEATKNVPSSFRNKYPSIEWKRIAGLRDKLIHDYFGVNLDRVWNIVRKDIPNLKKKIKAILEETEKQSNIGNETTEK